MEKKELYKLLLGLIPVRNHGEHEARIVLENAFKEFMQILKSQTDNCITDDIIKGTDNKIGFVSPVRRYEALDRCTAAANVI